MPSSCSLRSSHVLLCMYTLTGVLAMPLEVQAHGGNPLPLAVHTFGEDWVLNTNFGVITSDHPTGYVCEEIFLGSMNYKVLPFDTMTWLTISAAQLARTTDGGCTFTRLDTRAQSPSAVAQSSDRELVAWLTNDDPGASTLTWSEDRGDTLKTRDLSALGAIQWTGLHVSAEATLTLSGYSEAPETRGVARIFEVELSGEAPPRAVQGWEDVLYPYLFDVRAGQVAGIANMGGTLSLLWDGTAKAPGTSTRLLTWPVGMRISPDGDALVVAGANSTGTSTLYVRDGLGVPQPSELFPEDASSCVAWSGQDDIVFCARSSAQDFALASGSITSPMTRQTLVDFKRLEGPRSGCAPESALQKSCSLVWPELARALRIDLPSKEGDLDMGPQATDQGSSFDMGMTPDMAPLSPPDMDSSPSNDEPTCSHITPSQKNDKKPIILIMLGFLFTLGQRVRRSKR